MDPSTSSSGGGRGINGGVRKVIITVVMVVSLGYLIMWFILQSRLFTNNWKSKLKAKLTTTYFGTQGTVIFIFTIPVIFVSVLGSVYAHLVKQSQDYGQLRKREARKWLATLRRPVLIKGPLGVVSLIELSFVIMFLALLIWSLAISLHVGYEHIKLDPVNKRWEEKWKMTAFRLGPTGNICLAFLFYPVTRASTILPLLGITSEASVKYHIWLGHTLMFIFTAHGFGYLLLWAVTGQLYKALRWRKTGISNVAGELSLLFGLVLWITTLPRIRRKMFELFLYTHHLYILFILFFFLHVGISYAFYMLPCFFLFMIDRYLRFLQSRRRVKLISARTLSCEIIELNFVKSPSLSYNATSIIFVNIPAISKLQWHPFSISSGSNLENDRLSVIIKVDGSWTRKLYDMVSTSSIDRLEAAVEGPYGPVSNDMLRYETLVMISGGSGITPLISIIRELLYARATQNVQVPKILLISSFRKSTDLSMLNLLLPISGTTFDLSRLDLQIKVYITGEKHETQDYRTPPRTIWFEPSSTDEPIFPILGKNGYLWIGAIITSSFISFLILIAILTRYYIYPIDHNTNKIYPNAQKTILYLLILCVCIVITSSFAVLYNKRRNATQSTESRENNADRELESLPYQSIFESTQVQYGERPDLKSKLVSFKTRENNISFLVLKDIINDWV